MGFFHDSLVSYLRVRVCVCVQRENSGMWWPIWTTLALSMLSAMVRACVCVRVCVCSADVVRVVGACGARSVRARVRASVCLCT